MTAESFADWIGRSVAREDVATPRLLAEYRACLRPFLFEAADGKTCPPGFHWGLAPATPGMNELAEDASEAKGLFIPPIPYPRRMWAGGSIETLAPIMLNDAIRRVSSIVGIQHREGKSGRLYFVSVSHEISSNGVLAVRERQDLVFREGTSQTTPGTAASDMADGLSWTVTPSPALLFRFSALTFNGHRIHYDAPYAAQEGYPGLVVHGPLQAALMLNQMTTALGTVPRRFDYRCLAPLFGGPDFQVRTEAAEAGMVTRVIRHDGITTAEGRAHSPGT